MFSMEDRTRTVQGPKPGIKPEKKKIQASVTETSIIQCNRGFFFSLSVLAAEVMTHAIRDQKKQRNSNNRKAPTEETVHKRNGAS